MLVPPPSVKPIEHKHWSGNPSAALGKQPTEDEICQEFIAVGQLLIETAENKELSTQDRFQIFSDQIINTIPAHPTTEALDDTTKYQFGGTVLMGEFINSCAGANGMSLPESPVEALF